MNYPGLEQLIDVVAKLRDPENGCPWDLKQTHSSLLRYIIEETYEFVDAVEKNDTAHMEEEIGDVLLQVILHSQLASEKDHFTVDSVAQKLATKLIRRHPHVFEDNNETLSAEDVRENWEKIKEEEKNEGPQSETLIEDSILRCPSLHSAFKIGEKTQKIRFDWDDHSQVMYKVEEEWQELKEELAPQARRNSAKIQEEMGDFLFSIAQLARHLDMDPEETLRLANKKFLRRFRSMEELIKSEQKDIKEMNQKQMDEYWNMAKRRENASQK